MIRFHILIIMMMALCVTGCKSSKATTVENTAGNVTEMKVSVYGGQPSEFIPKALVYKTNGDYNDNVMVTLNPQHDAIVSYPDPIDVNVGSAPVDLGNGWLLDRRGGIGPNSAFLKYTYSEYSKLPSVPSKAELMQSIIPGALVTEILQLPITVNEAISNPEAAKKYIK